MTICPPTGAAHLAARCAELKREMKAAPTDRLQSESEIATAEAKRLKLLEAERLKRTAAEADRLERTLAEADLGRSGPAEADRLERTGRSGPAGWDRLPRTAVERARG